MKSTSTASHRRPLRASVAIVMAAVAAGAALAALPNQASAAPSTTFGASAPKDVRSIDEGIPVELGMRFTPSTDGTVSSVRFYKASADASVTPRSVSLWTANGDRLAQTRVSRTTSTGWISVRLTSPVKLTAGSGYVVSAFAKSGSYPTTRNYFSQARTSSTLTMPRNAGVYTNGWKSSFPTSTYGASNYWVDTEFTPSSGTSGTPAPSPATSSPATSAPKPSTTIPRPSNSTTTNSTAAKGLMGWQLNSHNVGLAPFGLTCSSLPVYKGSLTPAAGTRISGVRIVGQLDLRNGDIIVERSCIQPSSGSASNSGTAAIVSNFVCGRDSCPVISDRSIIIRDSEIDASNVPASQIAAACAFRGTGTLQRNYMHGMGSGICFYGTGTKHDAIAEQNYVTDLRSYGSSHNEAATVRDFMVTGDNPNRVARFTNNRLNIADGNVTAGLFIQSLGDRIDNLRVEGNLIEGGGYNLFLNQPSSENGSYRNVRAVNNRFNSTGWGPSTVQGGPGWAEWRDNYRYSPSAPDARGAAVSAS
ncbi:DUF4082 domain-containing protein [Acidipropionibacterium jensenii]|uniref:DUF4082 domain-containing protein n=1 Tax=Acidipropionibacterium jensenii TaxID=1749 RepID=A0A448NVI9_9ACTN|nr:DUF4082 domain-containing protein [Acidipropionibacterium jensenii]MDN5978339.1 DUF4082 domain-containing protein [Acidipropionibacterium jensenii]MDN5995190.1 DUF4082 domain-containing protein [Acidipropionibacterium jensenii]MDN6427750.1 DUF4082 domain-containing protein [Acidipropionibacterium jensenii]MDN6442514.1 DUF4082 domain-containing protein [Acidipropionibacterium jensenii]MDN6481276.1 DUF4082 domain-containing protein [Acidipropionibacterium jensenii]